MFHQGAEVKVTVAVCRPLAGVSAVATAGTPAGHCGDVALGAAGVQSAAMALNAPRKPASHACEDNLQYRYSTGASGWPSQPPRAVHNQVLAGANSPFHAPVATTVSESAASEAPFTLLPVTACTVHSLALATGTTSTYGLAAVPEPCALSRPAVRGLPPSEGLHGGWRATGKSEHFAHQCVLLTHVLLSLLSVTW